MYWPFKKRGKPNCMFQGSCRCDVRKGASCMNCRFYLAIDSGWGYCRALPQPIVVGWCKDVCSLFKCESSRSVSC